ncbi:MAG TPA: sulfatase, partial [Planctomycetota bacterium]|nr:sulfatase [Planctomycetota bacterium]
VPPRAWLLLQLAVMLAWLTGGAFLLGERAAVSRRGAPNERNADLPNVLLVVVDALRPDVLGAYGNATVQTPHLDALAANGVTFFDARVQAPYTWTSFGSWFTGKYPRRHGLMKMAPGVRMEPNLTLPQLLKSGVRAADGVALRDEDYVGGAFMTGALSHGSGLAAGFDSYAEVMMGHGRVDLDSRWSLFRSELLLPKVWSKLRSKLDPDHVVRLAREWLGERRGRRFVAFVHLYSTHTPYDPPQRWRELYVDPAYDGPIEAFYADHRRAIEQGEYVLSAADARQIYDLYLAGVSQADHHVGLLLADLADAGVLDDTLVIVTSDHGEDFGAGAVRDPATGALVSPGRWEHSHMYRSNLHVPLIVSWPRALPRGAKVTAAVESVDLLPTVAELAGLALPAPATPRDAIDGASLLPLVRGEVEAVKRFTFAEDARFVSIADERYMLTLERYAVAPDGWQVVLEEGLGEVRFHDSEVDPLQERNLFEDLVRGVGEDAPPEARAARERVLAEVERLRAAL